MPVYSVDRSAGVNYTATAAEIALDMAPNRQYKLFASTDAWYRISTPSGTAAVAAAADNHPIAANTSVLVGAIGARTRVSIIRATADGRGTLSEITTQAG